MHHSQDIRRHPINYLRKLSYCILASILANQAYASSEGACAIEEHTILFANPGTTHLDVVQDVESAAACCKLCQQRPGCNIFDWCNTKAADCSKNPVTGKSYYLVPTTFEFRPGACYLGNDPLPRQLSEKEEHVPWDSGSVEAVPGSPRPGVCATKAHTIYYSNAGTKEIGVIQDVKSAPACCQLCQENPACNIYDWCNIEAESCASNPVTGSEYNLGSTPYRPGSCWLGFDTSPRRVSEDEQHTPWDSGTVQVDSSKPTGAGCECPSSSPGQRLVLAESGAPSFTEPCSTSSPADTLAQCTVFEITGTRVASSCSEEQCYLQINPGGFYVADSTCWGEAAGEESSPPSNFGLPGDAACPGSECGCPATNPGQRLVLAESGAPYFATPCATATSGDPEGTASGSPVDTLPKCTVFTVTGKRAPSDCDEKQCYLEVSLAGKAYYVADYACGTTASNFGLPGDSRCPVCDAASCPSTGAGKRLVVAEEGAPYYSTPCNTGAAEGTLAKCTVFDIPGTRTASSCPDGHCYLATSVGGSTRYVVDYKCEGKEAEGSLPGSNFGLPGDPKCPAPPTGTSISGGAAFVAARLVEADSVDKAVDIAKADPYKTVYVMADSSSQTAADIKGFMEKYDPPTISGESTGYLCGNIPNSREIRTGHTVFKAYLDAVMVLNDLISAFGSPSTPSETASFPNGVRDPKCNPQEWCCKGADGMNQAVHWACLGPSSIVAAGFQKNSATLAESKTIVGPCAPLLVLLPRADRRGGANADVPSLLAYCETTKQYIAGWGAFSLDCGICGRETTISTSDSVLSTVTTGLINFVGDELMIMGCVGTVMDGTAISTSTVACGRVLADNKMVCPG